MSDITEWLLSLPDVPLYNSIIMDISEYGSTSKAICDVRVAKKKKHFMHFVLQVCIVQIMLITRTITLLYPFY